MDILMHLGAIYHSQPTYWNAFREVEGSKLHKNNNQSSELNQGPWSCEPWNNKTILGHGKQIAELVMHAYIY